MKIRIFTDGACSDNPGPGGWAAVFNSTNHCKTIQGNELSTTNNRMELMAVVKSLERILEEHKRPISNVKVEYELYSDSAYVVNAINNCWIETWQKNGWKTTKREDVKNKDLWERFLFLRKVFVATNISFKIIKIKGHAGNTFNEMVDQLAKQEVLKAKSKVKAGGNT